MARKRNPPPELSVVVPTIAERERAGWTDRCVYSYEETVPGCQVIVLRDYRSCGEAWIAGARQAKGRYLHFTADDIVALDGWFEAARSVADDGAVPGANVLSARFADGTWDEASTMTTMAYLHGGAMALNVLVPFLSRDLFEIDDGDSWLAPIHYGSDDWVTFLADRRGIPAPFVAGYLLGHEPAQEGRLHDSRRRDVPILCDLMAAHGPVPAAYAQMGAVYGWHPATAPEEEFAAATVALPAAHAPTRPSQVENPIAGGGYYWTGPTVAGPETVTLAPPEPAAAAALPGASTAEDRPARRRSASFKVWSGSQFKDELDVLEIRLGTIGHMVDRFVLAEATVDQRGREKPLVLANALRRKRFKPWFSKIEHVIVDDMPTGEGRPMDWVRERFQRDAILRGMIGDLDPDDRVLISDLDEIPSPEALQDAIDDPPMRFLMDLHIYRLNWRWLDRNEQIATLASVHYGDEFLDAGAVCPVVLTPPFRLRPDSGWHLTYQGDIPQLRAKMTGMADAFYEDLIPEAAKVGISGPEDFLTDEWIQGSIDTGRDIYARDYRRSEWVPLEELPPYVRENRARFEHMMVGRPAGEAAA